MLNLFYFLTSKVTFTDVIHSVDPMLLPSGNPIKCHEEVLSLQPMIQAHRAFCICFLLGGTAWRLI